METNEIPSKVNRPPTRAIPIRPIRPTPAKGQLVASTCPPAALGRRRKLPRADGRPGPSQPGATPRQRRPKLNPNGIESFSLGLRAPSYPRYCPPKKTPYPAGVESADFSFGNAPESILREGGRRPTIPVRLRCFDPTKSISEPDNPCPLRAHREPRVNFFSASFAPHWSVPFAPIRVNWRLKPPVFAA
jgi:hypothetical protein